MTSTPIKVPAPDTVGDLIKLLKQFPEDYKLDLFRTEFDDYGHRSEESVYQIAITQYDGSKSIDLTF